MDYFSSWDFWFYVFWISIAIGWGVSTGVGIFFLIGKLIDSLFSLKFKKEK